MSETARRKGRLRNFSAVPQECIGDKRLRSRHFRVLGAVCRAVNSETLCALVSQHSISRRANLARTKVGAVLRDLGEWGYITEIQRPRTKDGRFRTTIYRIHYEEQEADQVTQGGDTDAVTTVGESTVSPPGETDSNLPRSDSSFLSKERAVGQHTCCIPISPVEKLRKMQQTQRSSAGIEHSVRGSKSALEHLAKTQADRFEQNQHSVIQGQLLRQLFEAFPQEYLGSVVGIISEDLLERATKLEKDDKGAGVDLLVGEVKTRLELPN